MHRGTLHRQGSSNGGGSGRRFSSTANDAHNKSSADTRGARMQQQARPGLSRGGGSGRRGGGSRHGGRRPASTDLSEQELRRLIQTSNVQHTVSLRVNVQEVEPLQTRWREFEQRCGTETSRSTSGCVHKIPLAVFGLNDWEELIAFQRVVAGLRRPSEHGQEQEAALSSRARVQCDARLLEWKYELSFSPDAENSLWSFTNDLILQLKSAGINGRPLLPSRSGALGITLASVFAKHSPLGNDAQQLEWRGEFAWSRVVVEAASGEATTIAQVVHLPAVVASPPADVAAAGDGSTTLNLRYPELAPLVDELLQENAATNRPAVVILRGIPGSGKSTFGREIAAIATARKASCAIFSADRFFIGPRGYEFDVKNIGHAHNDCKSRFHHALDGGAANILVVDNTHTQHWEYEHYADLALQRGCRLQILEMNCPDLVTCMRMGKRNSHGVPVTKVIQMYLRWQADDRALSFSPQFEHAMLNPNPISRNNMSSLVYVGLFIEQEERAKLLQSFPPKHASVFGEHVTIFYKPTKAYVRNVQIGEEVAVCATELVHDERGQSLRVDFSSQMSLKMRNKIPHVTISTRNDVGAYYSNELLEDATASRVSLENGAHKTVVKARLGVALLSQNHRLITTTSPFAFSDMRCSTIPCGESVSDGISNISLLYVDGGDLEEAAWMSQTPATAPQCILSKLLLREQVQHHIGSSCCSRRILCVKQSCSSAANSTQLLANLQRLLLPSPAQLIQFDRFVLLPPDDDAQQSITQMLKQECEPAASTHAIRKVTVLTTSEAPLSWSIASNECFRAVAVSMSKVELPSAQDRRSVVAPYALTLTGAMDCLDLGMQEQTRHLINRGIRLAQDAWQQVRGGSTVQRIDSSLTGLDAEMVDLGVFSDSTESLEELHRRVLAAMEEVGILHHSSLAGQPGRIYFKTCSQATYSPLFRLQILESSGTSPQEKRMQFCQTQRQQVQQLPETETYTALVAILRAMLRSHCRPIASDYSLVPVVALLSERLVLGFLQQSDAFQTQCASESTENSGPVEELDAVHFLFQLLQYLHSWSDSQWDDELVHAQHLFGNIGQPMSSRMMGDAIAALLDSFHRFHEQRRGKLDESVSSKSSSAVLELLCGLVEKRGCGNHQSSDSDALLRVYVDVETTDLFAAWILCDAMKAAASKEHVNPSNDVFMCVPSHLAQRVEVAVASPTLLSRIMAEVRASGFTFGELDGDKPLSVHYCADDLAL